MGNAYVHVYGFLALAALSGLGLMLDIVSTSI